MGLVFLFLGTFFGQPFVKRFALCYGTVGCLSVLSCLSVTLVYCGQTVGRIKVTLGMRVGVSPGHIVLDVHPAPPPPKGHSRQFSAHVRCGQTAGSIKMPLGMEVRLGSDNFVLDADHLPSPKRGQSPLPNFWPMSIVAKRLDGSRCHLLQR